MVFSPSFPRDFKQALANTLTDREVDNFLKQPDNSPRFVYGALMLPTILKYYIDLDQVVRIERCMTQATLYAYQLYQYADGGMPVILPSKDPKATVEGMLVFGLNREQRNDIHEFESGLLRLASVQVQICQKNHHNHRHNLRTIDAGTFEWNPLWSPHTDSGFGLQLIKSCKWDVESFLQTSLCRHMVESQNRTASSLVGSCVRGPGYSLDTMPISGKIEVERSIVEDEIL